MSHVAQFFKHPRQIASLLPSSRSVAKGIADSIDFTVADHIVELGPGNGVVTRALLERMKPTATLTAIEINESFCRKLKEKIPDPRLQVIQGNALELKRYVSRADYIINEIPITILPEEAREQLLTDIKDKAKYACIQLNHSPFGGHYLRQYFTDVRRKIVATNFPPAFVYTARKTGTA